MSTPQDGQAPAAKDTFLKSLDALKQTLLIDSPIKRRLNQDVEQRLYEERQAYEKKIKDQKEQIELLNKKLAESASKSEREVSLRATLEKIESATKELNAQLRETDSSNTPLESKMAALEADMKKQEAASKGEKDRFDEQTKASTKEKEEASTKHDAIAARFLVAQKLTQDLATKLRSLVDEKVQHKDFVRGLENANKLLVKAMESGKAAKEIIAKEVSRIPIQVIYIAHPCSTSYIISCLIHSFKQSSLRPKKTWKRRKASSNRQPNNPKGETRVARLPKSNSKGQTTNSEICSASWKKERRKEMSSRPKSRSWRRKMHN
jgi:hypothetical protein